MAADICCILWTFLVICVYRINSLSYTYTIDEDLTNPTILGIVAQDVDLINNIPDPDDYPNLRYSFISQGPNTFRFSIDDVTSAISTDDPLDRDVICEFTPDKCEITLEVAAQSMFGTYFEIVGVTVVIVDQNDHAPSFDISTAFYLSISESSQIGREFTLESAVDKDSNRYSVVNYTVVPSTSPFTTQFTIDLDGSTVVKLRVSEKLDREISDNYQIQVVAVDGGTPPKTGSLDVNITIIDENDNAPNFSQPSYNVSVKEDTAMDTVILVLKAVDPDMGKNGEVIYKISSNQPPEIQDLFAINSTSGRLRVVKQLMPAETYKLIVEAYDKGDQPSKTQVFVFIHVEDSGNNPPEIKINLLYGEDQNVAKISEYASMGSPVAHVMVTDPDTGRNGIVTCSVSNSADYFQLQRLDVNEYKVIVHKPLDREHQSQYNISVFCEDVGSPPLNSTSTFLALVLDENDQYPQFSKPVYTVSFPENRNHGEVIIQVYASDLDEGENARLTYELDGDSGVYFSIDNTTGKIYSSIAFDRETTPIYKFQVISRDHGHPSLSSSATIELIISDENDNSPVFIESSYTALVLENMKIDSNVTKVYATDKDADSNSYVTFSLAPNFQVPFLVLPDGSIHTTEVLDREVIDRYIFYVVAEDHGVPARSSSVKVTVNVGDLNDNAPIIVYPNVSNDSVNIPYTARENTVIAEIQAHDLDSGLNKKLLFSVNERNDSDLFNVLSITGEVIVAKKMQESRMGSYFLQIVVMDQGTPYLSSVTKLTIIVSDRNATTTVVPPTENTSKYNVAIVVTVVVVTLVLSATILVTIFVIRRLDRQKQFSQGLVLDGTKLQTEKNMVKPYNLSGKGSQDLYSPPGERIQGVLCSYATEPALDRMSLSSNNTFQGHQMSFDRTGTGSKENTLTRCDTPQSDTQQSELHRLASLRLHQALIQSHDKAYASQHSEIPYSREAKKSTDDNSDTSGDTIPSDSGRGASDQEEVQSVTQSHTSEDIRRLTLPKSQYCRSGEKFHRNIPETNHYLDMSGRMRGINAGIITPQFHEELKNQPQRYYPLPRQQKLSLNSVSSDVPSYRHFQRGLSVDETVDSVATGYDDDDTTTSGSYTIDAEDFPIELHFEKVHDVFV